MEGARNVCETLTPADVVIVIDVTGTRTHKDISIEKCPNDRLRKFIKETLQEGGNKFSFDVFSGCPDPVCSQDETDIYKHATEYYFFLGLPVRGGDYNDGPVHCWKRSIDAAAETIILLSNSLLEKFDTAQDAKNPRSIFSSANLEDEIEIIPLTGI